MAAPGRTRGDELRPLLYLCARQTSHATIVYRELARGRSDSGLLILNPGNPATMNERVDWAAMSDEEFMALVRQLMETPAGADPDDD
ncbi:hypothetical protein GCM10009834_45780 [Streptomonospora arabica]